MTFRDHPCFARKGSGINTIGKATKTEINRAKSEGKPVYRGRVSKPCELCGASFEVHGYRYHVTRFCSRACYTATRATDPVSRLQYEVNEAGCWVWQRYLDPQGYGRIGSRSNALRAHKVSYEAAKGPVPAGLHLDHLCRNRACINPDHLEPVTPQENWRRGVSPTAVNAQKTHCKVGHAFEGGNVRVNAKGYRFCRACDRVRARRYRQERQQASQIICVEA